LKLDQAQRMKDLEKENGCLKKTVSELTTASVESDFRFLSPAKPFKLYRRVPKTSGLTQALGNIAAF
jgi:hypothetical protein